MLDNLQKYTIWLASNSPRRKELLSGLGIDYEVKTLADVDESFPDSLKGGDIPLYIACKKAEAYKPMMMEAVAGATTDSSSSSKEVLVITADTIVWLGEEMLGKPSDEADAMAMLRKLSGKTHEVITGVCLTTPTWQKSFAAVSEVRFSTLTEEEIEYYVHRFRPLDKAGSYGVQEWIGFIGVESISGSYFNVMGLPVQKLYQELKLL
ncbi:Maf-like protein [uncultured Bacteroides sp.]|uniref:Maf-like protein n=1 Tax=uncultured Bacteroides sp. TaxID=162156 RepID=UPI002AAC3315|nr:Maf-like protein [uncultured Bacteroides sp.]